MKIQRPLWVELCGCVLFKCTLGRLSPKSQSRDGDAGKKCLKYHLIDLIQYPLHQPHNNRHDGTGRAQEACGIPNCSLSNQLTAVQVHKNITRPEQYFLATRNQSLRPQDSEKTWLGTRHRPRRRPRFSATHGRLLRRHKSSP